MKSNLFLTIQFESAVLISKTAPVLKHRSEQQCSILGIIDSTCCREAEALRLNQPTCSACKNAAALTHICFVFLPQGWSECRVTPWWHR